MSGVVSSLNDMKPRSQWVIQGIEGDPKVVERLCEIGFVPGEQVTFVRRVIFGGPLVLEVRGTPIALRHEEASCLKLSPAGEP